MTFGRRATEDDAFRTFFDEHLPLVWRVLRRLGVPPAELDDVCQEVFVVAHRKLPEFEGRARTSTWLYAICARTWSDYRRRAYRVRERPTAAPPDAGSDPLQESHVEQGRALQALARALERLDDDKRLVFVLYEIEQLEMKEVVAVIGCPLQTGYTRLHAARDAVKAAFVDGEPEGKDA
jgi:RNA polymerase sigma-70 factor (ECF subfamily)